jgi:hypothetical protein
MRRVLDPIVKLWRDKVWGPRLRTYAEAREELGGVPWRKFTDTARWFLGSQRNLPPPLPESGAAPSGAIELDTGALIISKPGFFDLFRKKTTWLMVGGAALIVMVAVIASGGSKAPPPVAAITPAPAPAKVAVNASAPATANAKANASAPAVPKVKPASTPSATATKPKMSDSVKAMFSGKRSGPTKTAHLKKHSRRG